MKIYIGIFLMCVLYSCGDSFFYQDYKTLPEETWKPQERIAFEVNIPEKDTYSFVVCIRHTTDFESANLWCFLNLRDSLRTLFTDTLNLKIAEKDGRWLGNGVLLKTLEYPLKKEILLPPGDYNIQLEPGMGKKELKGIRNVGLKIRKKIK